MLFISAQDFFDKASKIQRLTRDQEKELYLLMKGGDMSAREKIVESYLIIVASRIKRLSKEMHSLDLIYSCLNALESQVDKFNFLSDGETFTHRLALVIQKETTNYLAKL